MQSVSEQVMARWTKSTNSVRYVCHITQ